MNERRERNKKRKERARLMRLIALLAVLLVVAVVAAMCSSSGGGTTDPTDSTPPTAVVSGKFELRLMGDTDVTLEYGSEFLDAGIQATYDGEPVQAEIVVDQPELDTLGEHIIRYTATYEGQTLSLQRTVTVVDTQAPVITLLTVPGYCTEPGEAYQEEGFTAIDNYDGDITATVERSQDENAVYYTVKDSSGNEATAMRQIVYGDSIAPVITLIGGDTVTIPAGAQFSDPGLTAIDNVDGDITANVAVTGEYEKYVPGTYTFTYTVTDAHGNTATVVRNVVVEGIVQPDVVDPEGKVIYLTFDDGPSQYTPILLEILAKYNVKATFFVVGTSDLQYLDDIVEGGHAIGVHSNTHKYSQIYVSEDAFFADFKAMWDKIKDYTGVETTLCRFPGGSSNMVSRNYCKGIMTKLTKAMTAQGYQYFDWNVDSNDAGGAKTAQEVYENVISGVEGRQYSVVLQHDIHKYSVDAVEQIIQWGLANGYTFMALDPTSPACHHTVHN